MPNSFSNLSSSEGLFGDGGACNGGGCASRGGGGGGYGGIPRLTRLAIRSESLMVLSAWLLSSYRGNFTLAKSSSLKLFQPGSHLIVLVLWIHVMMVVVLISVIPSPSGR